MGGTRAQASHRGRGCRCGVAPRPLRGQSLAWPEALEGARGHQDPADKLRLFSIKEARRACTAGDVLVFMYLQDVRLGEPEPSMGKAIGLVQQMHRLHPKWRKVPHGKGEIHRRIDDFRDVWHLWAGYRFLADTAPPAPGPGLPELDAELAQLLGLARTIQEWALTFEPKRGPKKPLLYEDSAYLVPEHIALVPDGLWPEQPQWITDFLANFGKRRANVQ